MHIVHCFLSLSDTIRPHQVTPWTSDTQFTLAGPAVPRQQAGPVNLQGLQTVAVVPSSPAGTMPSAVQAPLNTAAPMSILECGTSKGCLAEPAGCLNGGTCHSVVSYRVNPDRPGELLFELWRIMAPQGDQYVALGLNPTSPTMVGNAF